MGTGPVFLTETCENVHEKAEFFPLKNPFFLALFEKTLYNGASIVPPSVFCGHDHIKEVFFMLSDAALKNLDAWWRAANYLSAGQLYLLDNPFPKNYNQI